MSATNLVLTSPVIIDHDWQYSWFDCAHQHTLLLNDAYFYTLSFEDKNPTPNLFYHQEELPKKLVLAKVSLDMKIIAVQTTLSSILVIDTTNKKKWVVEIKNANDNNILPNGIIWSDHGGNSQDLIIVTARGIELYKISQMRGQCKLSRFIGQPGFTFWYEPSHRVIMMASVQKTVASPSGAFSDKKNEILLMDGYFLKYERSNMPLLELPPPDKAPRFELGPGVQSENIALHSLYGKLCCLVHFTGGDGTDFITVYYVTKLAVERAHCLAFNCSTSTLRYSVFDNVLICHSSSLKQSFMFDILSTSKKLGLVSETREAIEPVCGPSGICVEEVIAGIEYGAAVSDIKKPVALKAQSGAFSDSDSSGNSSGSIGDAGGPKVPNIILKIIDPPGSTPDGKTANAAAAAAAAVAEEEESEWNTIHGSQQRISLIQTATQQGGAAALAAVGMRRSVGGGGAGGGSAAGNIKKPESLSFAGNLSNYRLTSSTNVNNTPSSSSSQSGGNRKSAPSTIAKLTAAEAASGRVKRLAAPLCLQEVYDVSKFESQYVNLVYDRVNKVMYRMTINFPSIAKGEATSTAASSEESGAGTVTQKQVTWDPKEGVCFLSRRGQLYSHYFNKAFQAAYRDNATSDRLLDYTYVSESARICKQLLLQRLYCAIEERSPLTFLEDFVIALMIPYINEYRRQIKIIYDEDNRNAINSLLNGGSGGGGGGGSGGGNYVVSSKETAFGMLRRKTLSDGGVFGKNRRASASGPPESADCFQLEAEPLEALSSALSFTTYLPDISKTGSRVKTLLENEISGGSTSTKSNANSASSDGLSFVPLPLSTRRDIHGSLIVSQNEIIAYVWLPLFLNASTNDEMNSLTWSLQCFLSTFRELDMPILPALSILLMNVLFYRNRYMEMAKLVHLNFFPDSSDVAMASLEFRDILQDGYDRGVGSGENEKLQPPVDGVVRLQMHSAMQILQQAGIDMLYRLDDKVTLVLWHLGHARIVEAVMMCTKKSGLWRAGLPPACISGIEFFNSAMKAIEKLDNASDFDNDLKRIAHQIAENRRLDALEREELLKEQANSPVRPSSAEAFLRVRTSSSSSVASSNSDGGKIRIVEYVVRDTFLNQQSDALLCKRVDILILVYNFIKEWDNSVLLISSNLVKSKLAVQSQFPDHLFDSVTGKRFRDLFGFV